jgi:hypothetical protein
LVHYQQLINNSTVVGAILSEISSRHANKLMEVGKRKWWTFQIVIYFSIAVSTKPYTPSGKAAQLWFRTEQSPPRHVVRNGI